VLRALTPQEKERRREGEKERDREEHIDARVHEYLMQLGVERFMDVN